MMMRKRKKKTDGFEKVLSKAGKIKGSPKRNEKRGY